MKSVLLGLFTVLSSSPTSYAGELSYREILSTAKVCSSNFEMNTLPFSGGTYFLTCDGYLVSLPKELGANTKPLPVDFILSFGFTDVSCSGNVCNYVRK